MRKLVVCLICGALCALFLANTNMAAASELVYEPINPSFGGHPLNAQWLLDSAQVQNRFEEETDLLEQFESILDRQVLYRVSRMIMDEAFGEEEGFRPGSYQIGDYVIDIGTDGVVITVVMTDTVTGDTTIVEVPYY